MSNTKTASILSVSRFIYWHQLVIGKTIGPLLAVFLFIAPQICKGCRQLLDQSNFAVTLFDSVTALSPSFVYIVVAICIIFAVSMVVFRIAFQKVVMTTGSDLPSPKQMIELSPTIERPIEKVAYWLWAVAAFSSALLLPFLVGLLGSLNRIGLAGSQ